ncbi:hypothetical protein [Sphingomonas oryzagri]
MLETSSSAASSDARRGVDPAWLIAGLLGLFAIDNLLLLRFLGLTSAFTWVAGIAAAALIGGMAARIRFDAAIPARLVMICMTVGLAMMLLGGQGRMFFANTDWLVRDAVLQDMVRWPWPFLYGGHGDPQMLRAPLGMYLVPALFGKVGGVTGAEWAMLVQNGLITGALLALGSLLFDTARARFIALIVFLAFSGLDTIGQLLTDPSMLWPLDRHIDNWAGLQYSSTLTLAFWVPHHALAGWLGGVLFLLWRSGKAPLFPLLASVPLGMLWSPLAEIGILPFVALAGIETLAGRRLTLADIAIPAIACLLAWGPIRFMQVDPGKLGMYLATIPPATYCLFQMLEVLPFLIIIWLAQRGGRFGIGTFLVAAFCLFALPFAHVGAGMDLEMRGSIPALLVLAILCADVLSARHGATAAWMAATLLIGALTPLREVMRAVINQPAPQTTCDLWSGSGIAFPQNGKENYFANATRTPGWLRAVMPPTLVAPIDDGRCWPRAWQVRR